MAKVLVGCERSQVVMKAFLDKGHDAYSCDLVPCSGHRPDRHLQMDVFRAVKIIKPDLAIFHPPCTFLASSGAQWLSHPDDKHLPFDQRRPNPFYPNRRGDMLKAVKFVKDLYALNIPHIAIENPIGLLSTHFRKPDQIVQPWMFGDEATKSTCLWLYGLPKIVPTKIVGKGEFFEWVDPKTGKKKKQPMWYANARRFGGKQSDKDSSRFRSITFEGLGKAMAEQWGNL